MFCEISESICHSEAEYLLLNSSLPRRAWRSSSGMRRKRCRTGERLLAVVRQTVEGLNLAPDEGLFFRWQVVEGIPHPVQPLAFGRRQLVELFQTLAQIGLLAGREFFEHPFTLFRGHRHQPLHRISRRTETGAARFRRFGSFGILNATGRRRRCLCRRCRCAGGGSGLGRLWLGLLRGDPQCRHQQHPSADVEDAFHSLRASIPGLRCARDD